MLVWIYVRGETLSARDMRKKGAHVEKGIYGMDCGGGK